MISTATETRLEAVARLNDRCRQGFDRTAKIVSIEAWNRETAITAKAGQSIGITLEGRAAFRDYRRALLELLG